ncbi:Gallate 1-beta-glucosyltransferase [Linum perenne]
MAAMKKKPHVLLVPYPAQGHVVPMLKLAQKLADDHGISITVLNLDFIHQKLVKFEHQGISLAEVPDEIEPSFGQADGAAKVTEIIENVLPIHLRKLLVDQKKKKKNKCSGDGEEISWVIGDVLLSSGAFQVAKEMGIKTAAFWTASAENLALLLRIPQLIHDRVIDENGPLVTNSTSGNQIPGSFWHQDQTCSTWLDKHPLKSVIYVAFGSITILNQDQFQELALGLELTRRPFLWVIRADFVDGTRSSPDFPDGFLERVGNQGKIVEWANQEEVLSHRSIACFVSHCGWNSTLDGLWCGVPFLCWPYFTDQFHNKESICEGWKVGLELKRGERNGLITRFEFSRKVEELVCNATVRENAKKLRGKARECVSEGGTSFTNFLSFVETLCS